MGNLSICKYSFDIHGYSDKTDWMKEAYNGIVNGVGDCFTYYSMSQLLLNRIGIQTLSVERATKP